MIGIKLPKKFRAARSHGILINIFALSVVAYLFIIIWILVITADPSHTSSRAHGFVMLAVALGINHQPTPTENFWVWVGVAAFYVGGIAAIVIKRRRSTQKAWDQMDEAQRALYQGAYLDRDNLFAQNEMLIYDDGAYQRIPYTSVKEVNWIVQLPPTKYRYEMDDRLMIVYDDGQQRRILDFPVNKASHPAVIAARIAKVNRLDVGRIEKKLPKSKMNRYW